MRLCKEAGVRIIVTAGSEAKCQRCRTLGADYTINYNDGDFTAAVRDATAGKGVDVVLDCIGGRYLASNLKSLALDGRLVIIGLMGGARAEIDLAGLLTRRQQVIGSALRTRSAADKAAIVRAFLARFGEALEAGRLRPIVDRVLPLAQAAEAHRAMAKSEHFGKIALRVEQGAQ
jgi:NADPH:quinone reductase-like Zn-dependent oxidoreductase